MKICDLITTIIRDIFQINVSIARTFEKKKKEKKKIALPGCKTQRQDVRMIQRAEGWETNVWWHEEEEGSERGVSDLYYRSNF